MWISYDQYDVLSKTYLNAFDRNALYLTPYAVYLSDGLSHLYFPANLTARKILTSFPMPTIWAPHTDPPFSSRSKMESI